MRFPLSIILAFCAATAQAQTSLTSKPTLAQDGLEKTIAQLSTDPAAHGFEIGMLQTLRAIERTMQVRYEYGLGDRITGLPVMRLSTGGILTPPLKESTLGTFSIIIDGFVGDMAQARATLANAQTAGIIPFEMVLQDIWFDINANGTREETESALAALGPVVLGAWEYREFLKSGQQTSPLAIRFDEADHAWLMAYTHMLSGFGNLFMAFDPEPVLRDLADKRASLADAPEISNVYDLDAVKAKIAELKAELEVIDKKDDELIGRIRPIYKALSELRKKLRLTDNEKEKAAIQAEIDRRQPELDALRALQQESGLIRNEIRAAKFKLPGGSVPSQVFSGSNQTEIDELYVAIKALAQEPDPARIRAAHDNLRAMIHHNRIFWERLGNETDNNHEWIPNPSQESSMPFNIPPRLAEGWKTILKDVEATLEGKLLIHHPLLPDGYGISLPAYVADPSALDLIGWIHGIDAYRYAAKGPRLTEQSWQAFQHLISGNAGGFALFLN